ncbi:MAG: protein kinase [Rhodobacterales bacterium]|nr:protein kinase [Rhodobacterales bacterium]
MRTLTFNRVLGSGAMGTVYHAELRVPHGFARQCAVKVMRGRSPEQEHFRARMRDEARLLGMLQDEQVLGVLELTTVNGRDCVVMEYVDGIDLGDLIRERTLPPKALAELGADIAGALYRAHTAKHPSTGEPLNVIHRDIKPANVMITSRGGVRLLDFGVARAKFDSRESKTHGLVLGTLNYFPPEVLIGGEPTFAVDIYGLGLTLWECATGKDWGSPKVKPKGFQRRVDQRLAEIEDVYGPLVKALRAALAWDPNDRPDGDAFERMLLEAAEQGSGVGLRAWARKVVPTIIENRVVKVEDDERVGQTLSLDTGDGPKPLELIAPPVRTANGPEVMTYNDLAPPSAVNRSAAPKLAQPRAVESPVAVTPAAPGGYRPLFILGVAVAVGTLLGLLMAVFLILVVLLYQFFG